MGADSQIQWTTHTFNPWVGCERVSPACDHCYAEAGSKRLAAQHRLTLWGEGSSRFLTGEAYWKQPAKWDRAAEKAGERHRVFCASYADVFEDRADLAERRARLFRIIEETPSLDWLLLTKRPQHMVPFAYAAGWRADWPRNVWAGTTCEDQEHAEERIPYLLGVPASVRFASIEPQLGPIDLTALVDDEVGASWNALTSGLHWVICGGESGAKARPFKMAWARSLRDQCHDHGQSFFMKQLGRRIHGSLDGIGANHWLLDDGREWVPPVIDPNGHPLRAHAIGFSLFDSHGGDWDEWPADLRVRQFPGGSHV